MTLEYRASSPDLEVRTDARTVVGIAVPFGEVAHVRNNSGGEYRERFVKGAFRKTIEQRGAKRVKFLAMHDYQRLPLGRADVLREDENGLYAEFRVSKTTAGDEVLELIKDGALDALSVGFAPVSSRNGKDGALERSEVALKEVSAVSSGAYPGATIVAVRSDGSLLRPPFDIEAARRRLHLLTLEG